MNENLGNIVLNDDSQINKKTVKKDSSWLKDENHSVLKKLKERGGSIFLTSDGKIAYMLSPNEECKFTKDFKGLEIVLSNFLGIDVDLSAFIKSRSKKENLVDEFENEFKIRPNDLIMVSGTTFEPNNKEEFIKQENGTFLRNEFKLSKYLQMKGDEIDNVNFRFENLKTFYFLLHLLNHDYQRVQWVINWLAYFFQELKKSQVALVLIGIQGTGKNIFFNQIIRPLFGEAYTKAINDKSLNTKYKGSLIENVIFLNLDEISANTSLSDSQKNFIKALITNESVTIEKKFENLEQETLLYAQVLITSNEAYAVEIEPNDRRYTVFPTGETLLSTNFLGLASYEALSDVLQSELEMFACYLKAYPVDVQLANAALSTPEKDEMIYEYQMREEVKVIKQQKVLQPKLTKLQKNLTEYVYAIKNKNFTFFEPIQFEDTELFQIIIDDFYKHIFRVENLLPIYKSLYGNSSIRTNTELLRELQKIDFELFCRSNTSKYPENGELKEFFNLRQPMQRRYF